MVQPSATTQRKKYLKTAWGKRYIKTMLKNYLIGVEGAKQSMQNDAPNSEIIIYEGDSGQPSIEVRIEGETVWLTQAKLAELFTTSRPNITMHIKNIFDEGELNEDSVCKDLLHT